MMNCMLSIYFIIATAVHIIFGEEISHEQDEEISRNYPDTLIKFDVSTIQDFFDREDLYTGSKPFVGPWTWLWPQSNSKKTKTIPQNLLTRYPPEPNRKISHEKVSSAITNKFPQAISHMYKVIPPTTVVDMKRIVIIKPCVCVRPPTVKTSQMQCRVQGRQSYIQTGGRFTTICRLLSNGLRHSITTSICVPVKSKNRCALRNFTRVSKTVSNLYKRYGRRLRSFR